MRTWLYEAPIMKSFAINKLHFHLASALALLFSSLPSLAAELKIHDAWVAAAPSVATSQAVYICFVNDSDKDIEITHVSAKGYGMAMIHKTMMQGDMVMMEDIPTLLIPAHKMVTLEPGSMHIMLMDPEKIRKVGEMVALTVYYKDGTDQTFNLEVKAGVDKSSTKMDKAHHHE